MIKKELDSGSPNSLVTATNPGSPVLTTGSPVADSVVGGGLDFLWRSDGAENFEYFDVMIENIFRNRFPIDRFEDARKQK